MAVEVMLGVVTQLHPSPLLRRALGERLDGLASETWLLG